MFIGNHEARRVAGIGGGLLPKFESSMTMPDVSETHLATIAEVFPEPRPKDHRTLGQKLMDARVEMISVAPSEETFAKAELLLSAYAKLEQEITEFLADHKSHHLSKLKTKRDELWSQCRKLEDGKRAASIEVASLSAQLNGRASELSDARQTMLDANNSGFDTAFPNESEIANWEARREAAMTALEEIDMQHRQLQTLLSAAKSSHAEAAKLLAERVEQLRAADSKLIAYRQTM